MLPFHLQQAVGDVDYYHNLGLCQLMDTAETVGYLQQHCQEQDRGEDWLRQSVDFDIGEVSTFFVPLQKTLNRSFVSFDSTKMVKDYNEYKAHQSLSVCVKIWQFHK